MEYQKLLEKKRMDKKTVSLILKTLRSATVKWSVKNEILKECKVKVKIGYFKNGNRKYKTMFKCCQCDGLYEKVQVDHIVEVGQFKGDFDCYIRRLFCAKDNLQPLCKVCHDEKTAAYSELRADIRSGVDLL